MLRKRRPRILVVDDLADAADSLALLLGLWGYAAEVCYDGATALETTRTRRPRVVLLDVAMPRMDGFQVAQRLREQPEFADTVIIGITGYGDEAHYSRARLVGMDHYLVKPVDLDDLRALLGRVAPARPAFEMPKRVRRSQGGGVMSTVISPARIEQSPRTCG
jgi:two-component system CheB/CheR fusion protein